MPDQVSVSGELAKVRFELRAFDVELPTVRLRGRGDTQGRVLSGDQAVAHLLRTRAIDELQIAADEHFRAALRDENVQVDLAVKSGSVEIIAIITTVATVIQNYNAIVEGIREAVENTRRAFLSIIGEMPQMSDLQHAMELESNWRPGVALRAVRPFPRADNRPVRAQRTGRDTDAAGTLANPDRPPYWAVDLGLDTNLSFGTATGPSWAAQAVGGTGGTVRSSAHLSLVFGTRAELSTRRTSSPW